MDDSENNSTEKPAHLFKPGRSGNPGGRPKVVREALELFQVPGHIATLRDRLLEIAAGDDAKASVSAIREFLDRALGKAPQAITGEDGQPLRFDVGLIEALQHFASRPK